MSKYKVIRGEKIAIAIAGALGLEHVRRLVLDVGMNQPALLYVEFVGDERLYDVDFTGLNVEIKTAGE